MTAVYLIIRLIVLVTLRGNYFSQHVTEGNIEKKTWQHDEEEEVSSYRIILRKGEYAGNWIVKHQKACSGKLALKKGMDLS